MSRRLVPFVCSFLFVLAVGNPVRATNVAQPLPYAQDWSNTALLNTANDWSQIPGVIGFRGDNLTAANDINAGTVLADDSPGVVSLFVNIATPNSNSSGGVGEIEVANPSVALQGSGTADAPYLLIHLDTSGYEDIQVNYSARDMDGSADNAAQQLALHYRIGNSGLFTNVPAAYIADATTGGAATQTSLVSVTLPADADNQSLVQLRILTTNATGNDEWVGIDDIIVNGTPLPNDAAPTVTGTVPMNGQSGVARNASLTVNFSEPVGAANNSFAINCSISGNHFPEASTVDTLSYSIDPDPDFAFGDICSVTVVAGNVSDLDVDDPPDHMAADYVFSFSVESAPANTLSISAPAPTLEGDLGCMGGVTDFVFTVTASQAPIMGQPAGFNFTVGAPGDTADSGVDFNQPMPLSGQIAAPETQTTITVPVLCDNSVEPSETFTVILSDPINATLGTGAASATIINDDTPTGTELSISYPDDTLEGESPNTSNFKFVIQATGMPPGDVSVLVSTAPTGANPATGGGDDYNDLSNFEVSIPLSSFVTGNATVEVFVTGIGDNFAEPNEQFTLTLSNPTNATISTTNGNAVGTIIDDDIPAVWINNIGMQEMGLQGTFRVNLDRPAPFGGTQFDITTGDGTATDADNDYEPRTLAGPNAVVIPEGDTGYDFDITINDDTTIEPDETFLVTISNAVRGTIGGGSMSGNATIFNDDNQISIGNASVTEIDSSSGFANAVFTVSALNPIAGGHATVNYSTADGSASAGSDYVAVVNGTATILETESSTTISIQVPGDLRDEIDETFSVTISSPTSGISIGTATGTGTITDNDTTPTAISAIQGSGDSSALAGTEVIVNDAVVTSVLTTPANLQGFTVQMPVGDGNLATSDAILAFTGATPPPVQVGDRVDVRGTVIEFNSNSGGRSLRMTELSPVTSVNVTGTAALPSPFLLDAVFPSPDPNVPACETAGASTSAADRMDVRNLECLEWMRVGTSNGVISTGNQTFGAGDPYAEMYFSNGARRGYREPGVAFPVAAEDTSLALISPPAPLLPAGFVWDGNPELFELDPDRLGLPNQQFVPGSTFNATGVLGIEFADYEFWPSQLSVNTAAPTLPIAVPTAASDQLSIGSLNLLRLYDRCDDPGRPATGETVNVATTVLKLDKLSRYIRGVLNSPMVLGVQEAEQPSIGVTCANGEVNTSALQLLADRIFADGGPSYTVAYGAVSNDPGFIGNGFLYRADLLSNVGVTELRATETFSFSYTDGNAAPQTRVSTLHDRPSLLLTATSNLPGTAARPFAIMNNHLRSLGGIDDLRDTRDAGATLADPTFRQDAHRIRQKRLRQAAAIACEVQDLQATNPTRPLILVGDHNAFQFSDGYADTTGIIRGDTQSLWSEYDLGFDGTPGAGCVLGPNGQIVSPNLEQGQFALPEDQRYSFIFQANAQALDHAFLNPAAAALFERFAFGRGNADAPAREQTQLTPGREMLRASDHDGLVVYLNLGSDATVSAYRLFADGFE